MARCVPHWQAYEHILTCAIPVILTAAPMQPYRPLLKIILIKAVIFLTFWQVCDE